MKGFHFNLHFGGYKNKKFIKYLLYAIGFRGIKGGGWK